MWRPLNYFAPAERLWKMQRVWKDIPQSATDVSISRRLLVYCTRRNCPLTRRHTRLSLGKVCVLPARSSSMINRPAPMLGALRRPLSSGRFGPKSRHLVPRTLSRMAKRGVSSWSSASGTIGWGVGGDFVVLVGMR